MNLWQEKSVGPMLLEEIDKPFDSKDYIYEIKFDGIRTLFYVSPKSFKIISRNQNDLTHLFPELSFIKTLVNKKVIFDGEIISLENNLPNFLKLQKRLRLKNKSKIIYYSKEEPVLFMVFDIIYEDKNLINLPLLKRKDILAKYPDKDLFIKSKYIFEKGKKLFTEIKKKGLEGIVAKKIDSIYEVNNRSANWLKIKNIKNDTFYIGGYIEKESNYVITLVLGKYDNKDFIYMGKVSLGKKNKLYSKIKKLKLIKKSPFINFNEKVNYVNPRLKCLVGFLEKTKNNHLRQPFVIDEVIY